MKKDTSNALGVVSLLLTASGCFMAYAARSDSIQARGFGSVFLYLSQVTFVAGFVFLLAMGAKKVHEKNERNIIKLSGRRSKSPTAFHQHSYACCSELPVFRKVLIDEFGESEVAPLELWQEWHWKNPNAIQMVFSINARDWRHRIVGGFKMLPIDSVLKAEIESGKFTSGAAVPEEHVVEPGVTPAAWWLGDLISIGKRNGPFVMRALRDFALENLRAGTPVFTRPLTSDGLDLTDCYGFVTVEAHKPPEIGRVCALYGRDVEELLERLKFGKRSRIRPNRRVKVASAQSAEAQFSAPAAGA
jgi:hypothetical protein